MKSHLFKQMAIPISEYLNKFKRDESLWSVLAHDEMTGDDSSRHRN